MRTRTPICEVNATVPSGRSFFIVSFENSYCEQKYTISTMWYIQTPTPS